MADTLFPEQTLFPNGEAFTVHDTLPSAILGAAGLHAENARRGIFLIGSFSLMRRCIAQALQERFPCFDVIETDFEQAKISRFVERPDLVLLIMGSASATDNQVGVLVERVLEVNAESRTMIISGCRDELAALSAFRTGLAGFFLVDNGLEILTAAVNIILAGGRYIPPHLLPILCLHKPPLTNGDLRS